MYGSPGCTTIELASGLAGGKENTCQLALSASAVAIVPRRVVIALTLLDRPVLDDPQASLEREP